MFRLLLESQSIHYALSVNITSASPLSRMRIPNACILFDFLTSFGYRVIKEKTGYV